MCFAVLFVAAAGALASPAAPAVPAAVAAADPLGAGRQALTALDYERAVRELTPVANDIGLDAATRARAHVFLAEAIFATAGADAGARARAILARAFVLDDDVVLEDRADASPRFVALFEEVRRAHADAAPPVADAPSLSPWWYASAALAAGALVAGVAAEGIDLSLQSPPPIASGDDVRSTQRAGAVAVLVAGVAAAAALGTAALAWVDP